MTKKLMSFQNFTTYKPPKSRIKLRIYHKHAPSAFAYNACLLQVSILHKLFFV